MNRQELINHAINGGRGSGKSIRILVDVFENNIKELEKQLADERKLNEEIKSRFVKCNTCTQEMKDKCLMFTENLCEGERCEELVDLMALVEKNDLQTKYELLGERCNQLLKDKGDLMDANSRLLSQTAAATKRIIELEQQIEKVKTDIEKLRDGALRDNELAIYSVLDVLYNHNFEITKGKEE